MRSGIGNSASDPLFTSSVSTSGAPAASGTAADPTFATNTPNASSGAALNRVAATAVQGSLIVKASAGNLYGYNIVTGGTAGYLMIFDSTTVPADGTVTPKLVQVIAANASIQTDRDVPIRFNNGIVMVFSSTGPFTKTISATAFLAGDAS